MKRERAFVVLLTKLKGGVGASTLARELALAAMIEDSYSVALADLDHQGATTHWWNRRRERGDVPSPEIIDRDIHSLSLDMASIRSACNLVLVDCPPTVHVLMKTLANAADLALIPTRPNMSDLDAIGPVLDMLHGTKAHTGFAITQIGSRRSLEAQEAEELLSEYGPVLGHTTSRIGYARPSAGGLTGYEKDIKVRAEVSALWKSIKARVGA